MPQVLIPAVVQIQKLVTTVRYCPLLCVPQVLIPAVGLVEGTYGLKEEWLRTAEVTELYRLADVLLQPSRSEGFGLPIIEAQRLGTPVISVRNGAMGDFTRYGIAVPPIDQPFFHVRGFTSLPSLNGTVDALHAVLRGELTEASRREAMQWVRSTFSAAAVVDQFEALVAGSQYDAGAAAAAAPAGAPSTPRGQRRRGKGRQPQPPPQVQPEDCPGAGPFTDTILYEGSNFTALFDGKEQGHTWCTVTPCTFPRCIC